jgi:hypothetical protein
MTMKSVGPEPRNNLKPPEGGQRPMRHILALGSRPRKIRLLPGGLCRRAGPSPSTRSPDTSDDT